ncbi:phage terminase large subunit [Desulfotruncus alcoholivorax]|uniref:phage terminase large subunit n=1 Tax=Desulfotruncus alcoholivorax TaxID=265477 RepID=UPI0003F5DAB2|nr:phage terminase large subunit [Desulfotruncus alcoholivorax]
MGILNDLVGIGVKDKTSDDYEITVKLFEHYVKRDISKERLELLKEYRNGAMLTGPAGLRKKLAAIDLEYFGRAYLGHYFTRETPEFHRELDRIWQNGVLKGRIPLSSNEVKKIQRMPGCRRAVAAPRGHAKSTNLTFKDTLHAIVYEYKPYILILSDSSDQAQGFLADIREELEENQALKEDFGDLQGNKAWREDVLLTSTRIKIEAIGSGKKIRGRRHKNWRPALIVLDDIENDENVRTPEQRKKLENWFFKAVSKAGDDYTDIVYIGTILHYDSLLSKVLKNPAYQSVKYQAVISWAENKELWDIWEEIFIDLDNENRERDALEFFKVNKRDMLAGTKVLWEDKLSYYELMVMRISEGEASFNSEEQNEPINPEDCLFNEEWFDYYNEAAIDFNEDIYRFYGFVDPSLGGKGHKKKSDFSTIITLAKDIKTGYLYVFDADIERRHPDRIIDDILEKERYLRKSFGRGFTLFGCETNQFQWFLKEELAKRSAEAGIYLPIEEVNQISDKHGRIQTLQPSIKNRYIKFNPRHKRLLEQLRQYPMASHDDGPDALEAAFSIAQKSAKAGPVKYEKVQSRRNFNGKGAY